MHSLLFELFRIANDGRYIEKFTFCQLKSKLLMQYGVYDGYDVQEISNYKGKMTRFLKRYILNGQVFHLPTNEVPKFGENIGHIRGHIRHQERSLDDSYRAMLSLLLYYEPSMFDYLLSYSISAQKYYRLYAEEINSLIKSLKPQPQEVAA